jgi:hypothetical protein
MLWTWRKVTEHVGASRGQDTPRSPNSEMMFGGLPRMALEDEQGE